jgi:hypothetical protein
LEDIYLTYETFMKPSLHFTGIIDLLTLINVDLRDWGRGQRSKHS